MIRRATAEDKSKIMSIIRSAQQALRELGIDQWQDGYPTPESIDNDIADGVGYVACAGSEVVGYAAIIESGEPAYQQLDNEWLYGSDYVVVHRICVDGNQRRKGVALELMSHTAKIGRSISHNAFRIDTHRGNIRMLALLQKLNFREVGTIHYTSGERVAYELDLTLSDKL